MNNIDKLFKTKLDTHEVAPSAEAWQKLNGHLSQSRNNKRVIWMSIAASVALIIVAVVYFKIDAPIEDKPQIAETSPQVIIDKKVDSIITTNKDQQIVIESKTENTQEEVHEDKDNTFKEVNHDNLLAQKALIMIKVGEENKEVVQQHETIEPSDDASTINTHEVKATTNLIEENKTLLAVNDEQKKHTKNSSVKIVYNLQPVVKIDSSILKDKSTNIDSKSGVLGKIVAFAKNAKASDVSLGQLRSAKDNLLNLDNLKNDKQTQK